jgi:RNA polymerase-binding transcription factor DksA
MAKPAATTSKTAAATKKAVPAKQAAAPAKQAAAPAKKAAPAAKKAAPAAKKAAPAPNKAVTAKKATPVAKSPAAKATPTPKKAAPVTAPKKATPSAAPAAKKAVAPAAAPKKAAAPAAAVKAAPVKAAAPAPKVAVVAAPTPVASAPKKALPIKKVIVPLEKGPAKPIMKAGGDFDAKFLTAQTELLLEERISLVGQADRMESEAASLMEDLDPGDVQFDDESGEGDSLVVERERDLALSAQARQMVADIDAALLRIKAKTYGYSLQSGRPIPRERLKAIPWATELVEEKVGGLGSR